MKTIRTKQGIASFYTVAIATLLLGVLAVGFTTVVVNEINRTTNFDLSKSAYDSALAGVEDAKVAIMNYKSCLAQNFTAVEPTNSGAVTCGEIIWYMEHPDCYMVGHILGRIPKGTESEVVIQEVVDSSSDRGKNNMQQAYTCVKITSPSDYRTSLNSSTPSRIIPIKLKNLDVSDVNSIQISWATNSSVEYKVTNYDSLSGAVIFPSLNANSASYPPTLGVQLIQTDTEFDIRDLDYSQDGKTDRGFVYLVAADHKTGMAAKTKTETYIDVTANNFIPANIGFVKSNDKTSHNLPFLVDCELSDQSYLCSATIELPRPISTTNRRNPETFNLVVSLPYGGPYTDVALSVCKSATTCESYTVNSDTGAVNNNPNIAAMDIQLSIDSTGRANNLFRRVESRIEASTGPYAGAPDVNAIVALGEQDDTTIRKDLKVDTEETLFNAPAQICANRYKVTFSANGTNVYNVPSPIEECDSDRAYFVLPTAVPTRYGYTFSGWAKTTTATPSTILYQPGNDFDSNVANVNLYAIWEAQKVFIDYYSFDGAKMYQRQTVAYNSASKYFDVANFQAPKPTSPIFGYTLAGWSETPNSKVPTYAPNADFTALTDKKLYAVWKFEINVTFYQMKADPDVEKYTFYNVDNTTIINFPEVKRPSSDPTWIPIGWSRSPSQAEIAYASRQSNVRVTLEALQAQSTYYAAMRYTKNVTYKINGAIYRGHDSENNTNRIDMIATGGKDATPKTRITGFVLPTPTRDEVWNLKHGYVFEKWCTPTTSGNCFSGGLTYNQSNTDMEFVALLKEGSYTVTFKNYLGDKVYGTQALTYNKDNILRGYDDNGWQALKPSNDVPGGKTFMGWSQTKNNNTVLWTDKKNVRDLDRDITVYAVWAKTITATFHHPSRKQPFSQTLYNGTSSYSFTVPQLDAYGAHKAVEWTNKTDSVGSHLAAGAARTITSSENWYAVYNYTVTISYNSNGGGGSTPSSTGTGTYIANNGAGGITTLNAKPRASACSFTRAGYVFDKWAIGSATSNDKVSASGTFETSTNKTLYALWAEGTYSINLTNGGSTVATIYEHYGSWYSLTANGTQIMSSTTNKVSVPSKTYTIYYHDYDTNTGAASANYTSSETTNATFQGYYDGALQIVNGSGFITSAPTTHYNSNGSATASWGAGKKTLKAPTEPTAKICKWRTPNSSGTDISNLTNYPINSDIHFYSHCIDADYTVTLSIDPSLGYIASNSNGTGKLTDANGKATVKVKGGGLTKAGVSGNALQFTDKNGTYYYAFANDSLRYGFSSWSVGNGDTITGDTTITATIVRTGYTVTFDPGSHGYIGSVPADGYGFSPLSSYTFVVPAGAVIRTNWNNLTISSITDKSFQAHSNDSYYDFSRWSITSQTEVNSDLTITAYFTEKPMDYHCYDGGSRIYDSSKGGYICVKYAEKGSVKIAGHCWGYTTISSTHYPTGDSKCAKYDPGHDHDNCSGYEGEVCQSYYWVQGSGSCSNKKHKYWIMVYVDQKCNWADPTYYYNCDSGWNTYDGSDENKRCYKAAEYGY